MAELNINEAVNKLNSFFQKKDENVKVETKDIESAFTSINEEKDTVNKQEYAVSLYETVLQKEVDNPEELESEYLELIDYFDSIDGKEGITQTDLQAVKDEIEADATEETTETGLPEGWTQDENGVITDENGNEMEAFDAEAFDKLVEEGVYSVDDDGNILDADNNKVGVMVETTETDAETGEINTVTSPYMYKQDEESTTTDKAEKQVSPDDLPEGHTISDDGKILDKDGNEIGRTQVSYNDATGDGVKDKITEYFLYETEPADGAKTKLPDGLTQDENGVIRDENGREMEAVDAETIEQAIKDGVYTEKDGVIYNEFGQEVGRVESTESDAVGEDGVAEKVDSYYMYKDVPAVETVQVNPSDLPEGFTVRDDGKILDADGNIYGEIKETITDVTGDGKTDRVVQYFKYQEVSAEEDATKIPDTWTQNDDGTITDENGNKLEAVDYEVIKENGYTVEGDKILDADGNEVGRVTSSTGDLLGEDGISEDGYSYYLYSTEEAEDGTDIPNVGTGNGDGSGDGDDATIDRDSKYGSIGMENSNGDTFKNYLLSQNIDFENATIAELDSALEQYNKLMDQKKEFLELFNRFNNDPALRDLLHDKFDLTDSDKDGGSVKQTLENLKDWIMDVGAFRTAGEAGDDTYDKDFLERVPSAIEQMKKILEEQQEDS